jgi:type IV pilus assembly protein PilO
MGRDEIIQKLERLSGTHKLLMFGGVIVLGCALFYFFSLKPQMDKVNELKDRISSLESSIATYRQQVKKLPELEKKLESKKKEVIYAKKLLPESSSDVENLLSSIEKLGKDAGVQFLLFAPGGENKKKFYATRQVNLKLRGAFHNLMRFYSDISHLDRLVTVKSVDLKPIKQDGQNRVVLSANSELAVYRALTEQEIKARKKNK